MTVIGKSLTMKATLLVAGLCIASSLSLMVAGHFALRSDQNDDASRAALQASGAAENVLVRIGERVEAYAAIHANHPEIVAAVQGTDKGRMREILVRLFKQIKDHDPRIGSMEIMDSTGVVIMRGHRPDSFGDDKSKEPLVRMALSGQAGKGLAVSPTSGEFASESVKPIWAAGKVVGAIKVGASFRDETAAEIRQISGADVIFIHKGKVTATTVDGVKAVDAIDSVLRATKTTITQSFNGRSYEMAGLALPSVNGEKMHVLSLSDREPRLAKLFSFEMSLVGKSLVLLALVVMVAIWIVRRTVSAIPALTAAMRDLAAGNEKITIPHRDRPDEIGTMAAALEVFRDNAEKIRTNDRQEQQRVADRQASAEMMASIVQEVSVVIEEAASGDFSVRVNTQPEDPQLARLVNGINEINRVVDTAIGEFAGVFERVQNGDLTHMIDTTYEGRFGDLKASINATIARLSRTVATIQTTTAEVGVAAREISSGASDLSQRTEQQASSLEETAATTEELAASIKTSALVLQQTADLAGQATRAAEEGGAIAGKAVDAMARIETSSAKISEITSVIDEIAFQTNLLALNAAVEAARAGDAGRGFAVVASEVRTLAQRSSAAAKDIKGLISASQDEVADGVALVHSAGNSLLQIVEAARKLAATIEEVAQASGEQSHGVEEMSQTVTHLDDMTQQNAALSEQSAASATALSGQIERLNQLVAGFQTSRSAGSARSSDGQRAAERDWAA